MIGRPVIEAANLLGVAVLARLVAPAEFGRYAIALIVLTLASVPTQAVQYSHRPAQPDRSRPPENGRDAHDPPRAGGLRVVLRSVLHRRSHPVWRADRGAGASHDSCLLHQFREHGANRDYHPPTRVSSIEPARHDDHAGRHGCIDLDGGDRPEWRRRWCSVCSREAPLASSSLCCWVLPPIPNFRLRAARDLLRSGIPAASGAASLVGFPELRLRDRRRTLGRASGWLLLPRVHARRRVSEEGDPGDDIGRLPRLVASHERRRGRPPSPADGSHRSR